ncbi:hypothetical protein PIB30_007860 [Stylosanthes scabra]|uniref:RNase H type-1 domain-containing protein n=1 Tax=Stylosanthes scabra TaxID=79078 RepID=A0ABU6R4M4_9FABA|nr:hypothetical protein [Stylosanthes scabra]
MYQMQTTIFPSSVYPRIDMMLCQFLWKGKVGVRGLNLVKWSTVVTPKRFGGLDYVLRAIMFINSDTNDSRKAGWFWTSNATKIFTVKDGMSGWLSVSICGNPLKIGYGYGDLSDPWNFDRIILLCRKSAQKFSVASSITHSSLLFGPYSSWIPPPLFSIKVNCDESFLPNGHLVGFGCVAGDSQGKWLMGCFGSVNETLVENSELLAIWHGLCWPGKRVNGQ